jgi:hypothetical protein
MWSKRFSSLIKISAPLPTPGNFNHWNQQHQRVQIVSSIDEEQLLD